MNPRHYEIARQVLQRIEDAANARFKVLLERPESANMARSMVLHLAIVEAGSDGDEWCRQAFAGETLPLDLSGADLRGRMFVNGRVWQGANFRGAQLDKTSWFFAHVEKADFTGASMHNAYALSLCCDGTRFHEADLFMAVLHLYAESEPVDLSRARLGAATLFLSYPTRYVLTDAIMGCHVRCNEINMNTRQAHDLFHSALSEQQKGEITMAITAQDLAKSDQLAAAYRAEASQPKGGGCFIATACCGSPADPLVWELRRFRDEVLAMHPLGRALAAAYARRSPPVADWIAGRAWARRLVRHLVVRPLAWAVRTFGG